MVARRVRGQRPSVMRSIRAGCWPYPDPRDWLLKDAGQPYRPGTVRRRDSANDPVARIEPDAREDVAPADAAQAVPPAAGPAVRELRPVALRSERRVAAVDVERRHPPGCDPHPPWGHHHDVPPAGSRNERVAPRPERDRVAAAVVDVGRRAEPDLPHPLAEDQRPAIGLAPTTGCRRPPTGRREHPPFERSLDRATRWGRSLRPGRRRGTAQAAARRHGDRHQDRDDTRPAHRQS